MSSLWGPDFVRRAVEYFLCGRDYFGTVDQIPGRCHVQTAFAHVLRVPVIPYFSVLVLPARSRGEEPETFGIPFCWRSLAYAYARAALVVLAVAAAGVAAHQLVRPSSYQGKWGKRVHRPEIAVGLSALSAAGFALSYSASRPGGRRKEALIRTVGKLRAPTAVYASLGHLSGSGGAPAGPPGAATPDVAPRHPPGVPIALPPIFLD